jgi:uncharacterized protein (TIGR00297 family)
MWMQAAAAAVLNGALALGAYFRGGVTASGGAAGFLLGCALFLFTGPGGWFMLGFFFISSLFLGRLGKEKQKHLRCLHQRGNRRDHVQVAANGLPAFLFGGLFFCTGSVPFLAGFFASLACASADTWASEGGILSRRGPVDIVSCKPVKPGLSGGVTPLGTLFAAAGSGAGGALSAVVYTLGLYDGLGFRFSSLLTGGKIAVIVLLSGFAGSCLDSLLGSTLQVKYHDGTGITERPGAPESPHTRVSGFPWMTNDLVNFISVLFSAGIAALSAAVFL